MLPDPTAPPALPLASAVVALDTASAANLLTPGRSTTAPLDAKSPSASEGEDSAGEMEVILNGQGGLGRDYRVHFTYTISIW